ncbi:hypothetical protein [Pseudomonas sp. H9]|uniref:hypothetical protein n=1 Tax=Pseudomonas sp. H9 TaxID=483968 RepID=UPI001057A3C2|nr:hypothetical protein [Pseudomonas sp. H9]TDF80694.1 hypothetical protein E1573_18530 [Pseudomonas sp. H9]
MVGINAVSLGAPSNSATLGTVNINAGTQATAVQAEGEESPLRLTISGVPESKQAQQASEASASDEPAHIQQLRKIIEQLKKQLAEQQKQLQAIMTSKMEETAKATAVAAAQSAVSTTMGALMTATAQLAEALLKSGGGAGGMVSTTA